MINYIYYKQNIFILILCIVIPFKASFAQQITSGFGSWKTLKTKHFHIHYPEDQRRYAIETAHMAQSIHNELEPLYKSKVGITHVSLVFETDTVNAFATTFGFDQIVLFLDQPRLGEFSRYNQWARLLFIHEYTHILSLRHNNKRGNDWLLWLTGVPPNQISPFGLIEGTAVHQESKKGIGRMNDPLTEMTVRTAVLSGKYPSIGEIMNGTRRWPYARVGYLYGSRIWKQLVLQKGEDAIYNYWNDTDFPLNPNARLPYRLSLRKLYLAQRQSDEEKSRTQEINIKDTGETKYKRMTRDGNFKRFLSINDEGELLYFAQNLKSTPGLFRMIPGQEQVFERRQVSSNGISEKSGKKIYSEDYLYFSGFGVRHELYNADSFFPDRIAKNRHLSYPSLSNDADTIIFVERNNHKRFLVKAKLDQDNKITQEKIIFEVPFEGIIQYTDISSDKTSALSIIRTSKNNFASLYICDLKLNKCEKHLSTKGIITQPRFLPDGSGIVFTSDASGIYNLYKYNPITKRTSQLTRTLTGLFYPTPSQDGKLYALRYFYNGYDVVSMQTKNLLNIDSDLFLPLDDTEQIQTNIDEKQDNDDSKNEQNTGLPENWQESSYGGFFQIKPYLTGIFGPVSNLNLGILGRDPLLRHSLIVAIGYAVPDPVAVAIYDYTRYNLGLSLQYSGNYWNNDRKRGCLNEEGNQFRFLCDSPWVIQENANAYIRYTGPGRHFSEQILLGYTHNKIRNARRSRIVEYDVRDLNLSGPSLIMLFGDTQFYPMSVSAERGWRFFLSTDYYTKPESKKSLQKNNPNKIEYGVAEGGLAFYLPSFWDHHVNYLSAYGYTSYGPEREIQKVRLNRFVRGIAYNKAPKNYAASVLTYEYRFPFSIYSFQISDDSPGSMLNNVGLGFFADYGATFDKRAFKEDWVAAYGVNLSFSLNVAYLSLPELKLTYAKGTGVAGESQLYLSFNAVFGTGPTASDYQNRITTPYRKSLPGFNQYPGYFRDTRAGGILD